MMISALQHYLNSQKRRYATKQGFRFLIIAPLIGDIVISLCVAADHSGGARGLIFEFFDTLLFGVIPAYMVAGIPAYITGFILFSLDFPSQKRLWSAPLVGFGVMFVWALLFWSKMPGENVFFALLMGGLAALASTALVAAIQRLESASNSRTCLI